MDRLVLERDPITLGLHLAPEPTAARGRGDRECHGRADARPTALGDSLAGMRVVIAMALLFVAACDGAETRARRRFRGAVLVPGVFPGADGGVGMLAVCLDVTGERRRTSRTIASSARRRTTRSCSRPARTRGPWAGAAKPRPSASSRLGTTPTEVRRRATSRCCAKAGRHRSVDHQDRLRRAVTRFTGYLESLLVTAERPDRGAEHGGDATQDRATLDPTATGSGSFPQSSLQRGAAVGQEKRRM